LSELDIKSLLRARVTVKHNGQVDIFAPGQCSVHRREVLDRMAHQYS